MTYKRFFKQCEEFSICGVIGDLKFMKVILRYRFAENNISVSYYNKRKRNIM